MKMEDIITFIAIVDHKGILKAADHLYVSQSTVSNRLLSLEQFLNTKLIERSPGQKTLALTKRGEEFLSYAREYVFLNDTIQEWSARTPRQRLRIGTIDSISGPVLKEFYRRMTEQEDLFLEISHHWTDRIFELLDNHHLDVGIIPRLFHSKNIDTFPIFQENMVVVSYSQLKDSVHPRNLDPANELSFDWGNPFITWHRTWFDNTVRPKIKVDTTEPLFDALKMEDSWAFVPNSVAVEFNKRFDFNIAEVLGNPPKRMAYFATRSDLQPQKKEAIQLLRENLYDYIAEKQIAEIIPYKG